MTQMDRTALAYLARKDAGAQWRGFLRALLETLEGQLDQPARDALLREVGRRFAAAMPLPPAETLAGLEARMNEALAAAAWGYVTLALDPQDRRLHFTHHAAPCIATAGDGAGAWLGPVLEGLFGTWLSAQPGGEEAGAATVRLTSLEPGLARLQFGA
ncbi:cellulose biosynthesis protein BcsD [Roseomonas marmotae]|uniref:Cellulose synthase n=1 Tax=Roseomonas marmotae TaxID=2768161 RepID=A0ABS3KG48_9PROT|nr:cellulose biosynthesis protein BcsD [Roseomonas marmotae]MBO1075618.1 cellulose synthase [Roseomonas marmotae]QTI79480.1 cellulose synthase [Roseomonas marmotae]